MSLVLYRLADTKIVRHQKVKGEYNPFDPEWFAYAEQLLTARMSQDIWDTQRLKLWMQQGGKCVLCEQFIDSTPLWTITTSSIVRTGSHALSNRVLAAPGLSPAGTRPGFGGSCRSQHGDFNLEK